MVYTDLNWGIIGAGIIARKMAEALQLSSGNNLVAVASKTPEKAKEFAAEFNLQKACTYEEIVADPRIDAIYIATTHNFHYENALLALGHGKHVLIEKPLTVNAAQASDLVNMASKKSVFLMEAMWTRFLPSVRRLREMLHAGAIGEVKLVDIAFGVFTSPKYEKRLNDPALAGGVTLDMGIYPISFSAFVLGEIPSEIKSMTRFSDLGVDELCTYNFRFPSGCFAQISTSFNLQMKNEAIIYGSKGYVSFPNFHFGDRFTLHIHNGTKVVEKIEEVHIPQHENGFIYQVEEMAKGIRLGKMESPIIPLSETIAIMEVMDQMRREWGLEYPFEK